MKYSSFVENRLRMFSDRSTFWGRNRYYLIKLLEKKNLPNSAYHKDIFDVVSLEYEHPIVLLKRKYLKRLKEDFMKLMRRGKLI